MTQSEIDSFPPDPSAEEIKAADAYLKEYGLCKKALTVNKYEKEFMGGKTTGEDVFLQAKMRQVKDFVYALPPRQEKLFLNCYYLRGFTVEKSAELMDVSVRSAFRLKKRALCLAALALRANRQ